MFVLKYVEGKDFFSFESFSIRFTKGTTLITGYDDGGKDSNGSGKSTILNAICWCLFGRTLKGVSGSDVVRWGCKDCYVILIFEGEGHTYEIKRSLNKLIFKIDGSVVRGQHRDIQSAIETSFKTNYALFIRSTAFSQSQVEFLAASGDAEKKRVFKEILALSRLDKAYDNVRIRYEQSFRAAEIMEAELGNISISQENLKEKIRKAQEAKDSWEETVRVKVAALNSRRHQAPKPMEPLQKEIAALKAEHADEFRDLDVEISSTETKIINLSVDEGKLSSDIDRVLGLMKEGQKLGSRCELCGSVINKKMLNAHNDELKKYILDVKKQREEVIKERTDAQDYLKYLYTIRLNRENLDQKIKEAFHRLAVLEIEWTHYLDSIKNIEQQIKETENGTNPYEAYICSFSSELADLDTTYRLTERDFEDTKRLIDALAFLKFTLSREGAVNQIIEREYGTLVSYSNRMLNEISAGVLRIAISPVKELKSGALKDEIEITAYVNGNRTTYWGLSDGQRQRINIALLLALNKLCKSKGVNSFDFLLLDEVLDISLAEGGQQDVVALLKNYQRECSNIILISHKEAFKTSFTSCLSVFRNADGVSRLTR